MSVTSVREVATGRSGDLDDGFKREYKRVFRVVTNANRDGPKNVRAGFQTAAGITIWSTYASYSSGEIDLAAYAVKIECEPWDEEPQIWRVTVSYSTEVAEQEQEAENPLDEPADIEWSTEPYQKAVEQDINETAIRNSALDPYDPPVQIDDSRLTLTIERNEWIDSPDRMREFQDAVSSDAFFGMAAGEWKVAQMGCKRMFRNGVIYWRWTYKFHHRREGWRLPLLDAGYREWDGANYRTILDAVTGQAVQQPALLNGLGFELAHGAAPVYTPIGTDGWEVYKTKSFAGLNLP